MNCHDLFQSSAPQFRTDDYLNDYSVPENTAKMHHYPDTHIYRKGLALDLFHAQDPKNIFKNSDFNNEL